MRKLAAGVFFPRCVIPLHDGPGQFLATLWQHFPYVPHHLRNFPSPWMSFNDAAAHLEHMPFLSTFMTIPFVFSSFPDQSPSSGGIPALASSMMPSGFRNFVIRSLMANTDS